MAASTQIEIERKYEPGTGATPPDFTAIDDIAAVDIGAPVTLKAVYFDTDDFDLAAHGIALRRREGGGDDGWHLKVATPEGTIESHWPLALDQPDARGVRLASAARSRGARGATGAKGAEVAKGASGAGVVDAPPAGQGNAVDLPRMEVPAEVLEPVRSIVRDRPVSPIARVETVRTVTLLRDERGMAIAEFADDTVSALDLRRGTPRTWREWEVELLSGAPRSAAGREAFFDSVEPLLASAGAERSQSHSKLAHTLGNASLQALRAERHSHRDELEDWGSVSAASVVVNVLRELVVELLAADPLVRAGGQGSVHAMRRLTRKLRSVLASYRRLFKKKPVDRIRAELRWLGRALGEARDAEVRRDRAARELQSLPVADAAAWRRLVEADRQAYAEALDRVRNDLLSEGYFRLLDELDDFVERPPLRHRASHPAKKVVAASVRKQVATLRKRADAAQSADVDLEIALHNARKAARRLRYAIVTLGGGGGGSSSGSNANGGWRPGKRLRAIAAAAKPVVASLGAHRDRLLLADRVSVAAREARTAGEDTFVYGLILGGMNERARSRGDSVFVELNAAERTITKLARS